MRKNTDLPDGTYVELVKSLFATLLPTVIMSFTFLGIGGLILSQTDDPFLATLIGIGAVSSASRIGVLTYYRRWAGQDAVDRRAARRIEFTFAATYLSFAIVLGGFGVRALRVAPPQSDMLVVALLIGYGAGVAAGIALRPWIAVSSMLVAIVPTVVMAAIDPGITFKAVALLMAALLAGGINSLVGRYRSETSKITMRRMFATLARQDHLTGLSNRLSLAEQFQQLSGSDTPGLAVHCLDLDRFKPVNDTYGHPVGDALLEAVAKRLTSVVRGQDFAARTGGDEFVVIQVGINHPDAADMLARRIARAISEPFTIHGHLISIGTSIGYALSADCGLDLERLLTRADEALCHIKRMGGGMISYGQCAAKSEKRQSA